MLLQLSLYAENLPIPKPSLKRKGHARNFRRLQVGLSHLVESETSGISQLGAGFKINASALHDSAASLTK